MYNCEICGDKADIHHIIHRSEGGFDIEINYKYLCALHHRGKNGPHQNQFVDLQYKIDMQIINKKNNIEFSNNDLIKFFDYDKIEEGIIVRYRKDGDKMVPIGMKGTKKLKDIFINLKIPKESRDIIPIVCFDEKIAWVVDVKVSEQFKVTSNTKQILKITFKERV